MSIDRLRTVEWARVQLDHKCETTTYRWLKRHGVPVFNKRFAESAFFAVFRPRSPERRKRFEELRERGRRAARAQLAREERR